MHPSTVMTRSPAAGHCTTFHTGTTRGPNASHRAAYAAADGPTMIRPSVITTASVNATVSAIAISRTRHHGRRSVTRYAWLSVSTSAAIPDDMLQIAPIDVRIRKPAVGRAERWTNCWRAIVTTYAGATWSSIVATSRTSAWAGNSLTSEIANRSAGKSARKK